MAVARLNLDNFTGTTVEAVKQDFYSTIFVSNLESIIVNDAEKELIKALEIFVEDQVKHGTSLERKKKVLKDYGHAEHLIQRAILNYKAKPKKKSFRKIQLPSTEKLLKEHILLTSLISTLIIIITTAAAIDESPGLIFIGFIPTVATILISYNYTETLKSKIFTIPFIAVLLIYALGFVVPAMQTMELGSLAVINLILSLTITTLFQKS